MAVSLVLKSVEYAQILQETLQYLERIDDM